MPSFLDNHVKHQPERSWLGFATWGRTHKQTLSLVTTNALTKYLIEQH